MILRIIEMIGKSEKWLPAELINFRLYKIYSEEYFQLCDL